MRRLRDRGVAVWVTDIETVPQALESMRRLLDEALGLGEPGWLRAAADAWSGPVPAPHTRVVVPIWRDPWMVVATPTFTADLLARLGYAVVGGSGEGRYPTADVRDLDDPRLADAVLLPDEPYEFTAHDGPEAFERLPTRLVSGRLLTWYGPALVDSRISLDRA